MSLKTLMAANASAVFMDADQFAEVVLRRIKGRCSAAVQQTAVVFYEEEEVERGRGKGTLYASSMEVTTDTPVTPLDAYTIGDVNYEVVKVAPAVHGLKRVYLRRYEGDRTEARVTRNLK